MYALIHIFYICVSYILRLTLNMLLTYTCVTYSTLNFILFFKLMYLGIHTQHPPEVFHIKIKAKRLIAMF